MKLHIRSFEYYGDIPQHYLKVIKKRLEAIHNQKMYQKCVPNYQIEVDYREANFTEYLLRMMVWENKFADTWFKYGNGMSKEEYVVMALNGLIREEKIIRRR